MRLLKPTRRLALLLILTAALASAAGWRVYTLVRGLPTADLNTKAGEIKPDAGTGPAESNPALRSAPAASLQESEAVTDASDDTIITGASTDMAVTDASGDITVTGASDDTSVASASGDTAVASALDGIRGDYRGHYSGVWKDSRTNASLSVNFSPYYLPGSDPEIDTPVTEEAMCAALDAIEPFSDTIRTFGSSGQMFKLYPLARERGFRVYAGCWIGAGYSGEQVHKELSNLADIGNRGLANALIVGSEGLLRGDYSAADLIGWLNDLRGMLTKDVPVGVSDAASSLLGYPEVIAASDVAMFTYYPFFNSIPVSDATADFERVYRLLQNAAESAGSTKLICSETGWKFEGNSMGAAVSSPENAARYLKEIYEFSRREGVEVIFFEPLPESWKSKHDDAGWNFLDNNLKPRPEMRDMLDSIAEQRKDETQ